MYVKRGDTVLYDGNYATVIEPRLNTVVIKCYDKRIVTTYSNLSEMEEIDCKECDNGRMVDDDFDKSTIPCEYCNGTMKRIVTNYTNLKKDESNNERCSDNKVGNKSSEIAS